MDTEAGRAIGRAEKALNDRREASVYEAAAHIADMGKLFVRGSAIDATDREILRLLLEDSRRTHKEIGERVHLTGQAVGARVRRMQDGDVIEGYTLRWNPAKAGVATEAFVTVFLDSGTIHQAFLAFAQADDRVAEIDRTSGEGCYLLKVRAASSEDLNDFLQTMLNYGNYRVNLSMGRLKG